MTTQSQNISSAEFRGTTKERDTGISQDSYQASLLKSRVCRHGNFGSDPRLGDPRLFSSVPRCRGLPMLRYLACTDPEIAQKLWGVVEEETRAWTAAAPAIMNTGDPIRRIHWSDQATA